MVFLCARPPLSHCTACGDGGPGDVFCFDSAGVCDQSDFGMLGMKERDELWGEFVEDFNTVSALRTSPHARSGV